MTPAPRNGSAEPRAYLPAPEGQAPRLPHASAAVDINAYLAILARRRLVFAITFASVLSLAAGYVMTQPKVFRATTKAQVVRQRPIVVVDSNHPGMDQALPLETEAKKIGGTEIAAMASDLANTRHKKAISAAEIVESIKVTTENPDVVAISAESSGAERAADIANIVMEAYVKWSGEDVRLRATSFREALEKHEEKLKGDLRAKEGEITAFRKKYNIQNVDPAAASQAKAVVSYDAEAELARASVQAALAELGGLKRQLRAMKPTRPVDRVEVDPLERGFREEIDATRLELARARLRYDEEHPRVVSLSDRLEELQSQLTRLRTSNARAPKAPPAEEPNPEYTELRRRIGEQEMQLNAMQARAGVLASAAARNRAQVPTLPPNYLELARLLHSKDISEKAYLSVLEQLNAARANEESLQSPVRTFDRATVPLRPIRPNPKQTLALAVVLAVLAGLSLAYLVETTDQGVYDADDLMMRTGVMPLGFVSAARDPNAIATITSEAPRSSLAEGFRLIHANLIFSYIDSPLHTVMVTSAAAGEGKTLVATNLAIVFAEQGKKTLLVEADLRRPRLHKTFGCEQSPGLTEVLMGDIPLAEALRPTGVENLQVLPSGALPVSPAPLLHSRRMADLIEELRGHAEVIVFDTPPAMAVADAVLLSPKMDATILVVQQGRVSVRAVAEVRRMILQACGTLAGVVMNRMSARNGSYYTYHIHEDYHSNGDDGPKPAADREEERALT